jgi:hydroxymethylbilane synthase
MSAPIIGSRGSDLALWQANHVKDLLGGHSEILVIKTRGDRIQHLSLDKVEGKGFFTKEIEDSLQSQTIDVAVHSYKDLPTEQPPGLIIAGVPPRAPVADVLVRRKTADSQDHKWNLPEGAQIGTSSIRRKAQLLSIRPDLKMVDIRGNVPTRFNKVLSGELDAVVLAEAGLSRLGYFNPNHPCHEGVVLERLDIADACPAPAQGALAIQVRADDEATRSIVERLTCHTTAQAVEAERWLLRYFGGGCHLPLGAFCTQHQEQLELQATVTSPDGETRIRASASGTSPEEIATRVYEDLTRQGAKRFL